MLMRLFRFDTLFMLDMLKMFNKLFRLDMLRLDISMRCIPPTLKVP